MSERPSWMPSGSEINGAASIDLFRIDGDGSFRNVERLIERTALKAQIEVMEKWCGCYMPGDHCPVCEDRDDALARLAELEEGK